LYSRPVIRSFKDFAKAIEPRLYAEAAALYAKRVAARAVAVYQVGNVNYPGLSDLDLLVVIEDRKMDNAQYFSVYRRLPKLFHDLFLHEPFILPKKCLAVLRFTSHARRQLLYGQDIAATIRHDVSPTEAWCRALEGLCTYDSFFALLSKSNGIRVRHLTAVGSSLRFTLRNLDMILGTDFATDYGRRFDALRKQLMADPKSETTSMSILCLFYDAFVKAGTTIRATLLQGTQRDLVAVAKQVLMGELKPKEVDSEYIADRFFMISEYHRGLQDLRMPYGYLFFLAAYSGTLPLYKQNGAVARFFNAYYRLFVPLGDLVSGVAI